MGIKQMFYNCMLTLLIKTKCLIQVHVALEQIFTNSNFALIKSEVHLTNRQPMIDISSPWQ